MLRHSVQVAEGELLHGGHLPASQDVFESELVDDGEDDQTVAEGEVRDAILEILNSHEEQITS